MSPTPYLANSLVILRREINTRWPQRDHTSDGWIGDAAHQGTVSDHNPDPATGVVRAIDIDSDGLHVPTVLAACMVSRSTSYLIHNRRIWSARDDFRPRAYTGTNPHTGHIHESALHTEAAEQSAAAWPPVIGWTVPPAAYLLRVGAAGSQVELLQAYLNGHWYALALDGQFGPATLYAVRDFQRVHGLVVDGIVGPATRKALQTR